jgi:hypothetical protein
VTAPFVGTAVAAMMLCSVVLLSLLFSVELSESNRLVAVLDSVLVAVESGVREAVVDNVWLRLVAVLEAVLLPVEDALSVGVLVSLVDAVDGCAVLPVFATGRSVFLDAVLSSV